MGQKELKEEPEGNEQTNSGYVVHVSSGLKT